jgi:glycosyltransferase involved in cell wall biosynthesis
MKKIGIISSIECYGGVQTCTISLIRGLNNIGIIPDLISDSILNQDIIAEFNLRINYVKIKYSISRKNYYKLSFLRGFIELLYFFKTSKLKNEYNFLFIFTSQVIVNNNIPHLYYLSMSPNGIGITDHLFLPKFKLLIYNCITKFYAPVFEIHGSIDNYVINSKFTAKIFFDNYKQKIKVIYPSNLISEKVSINNVYKNTVLFLSRIEKAKRPEIMIELAQDNSNMNFVILGSSLNDVYVRFLKEEIVNRNLNNIQIFTNPNFDTVVKYLELAKFYVFPGIKEHFGISTVEAMMYGAIPFVHNSGGQKEIVPWDELRFDDENYLVKFKCLISLDEFSLNECRKKIEDHLLQFREKVFINNMLKYINN